MLRHIETLKRESDAMFGVGWGGVEEVQWFEKGER